MTAGFSGSRTPETEITEILHTACREVGIPSGPAELIRQGENTIFRLPGRVVVRISQAGQGAVAMKEIAVARWLEESAVPAVRALPEVARQPVVVNGRAVTFWEELPAHRHGAPHEVALALRRLHTLPPPVDFELDTLAPMTRLRERIEAATTLDASDRGWLRNQVENLTTQYADLPAGLPLSVVHGDAWVGNVVVTADGTTVLLDLERCSVGPPEWDLVSTAIKSTSFGWITAAEYSEFVELYGYEVALWDGFELLRDIRELRMTCYVAQQAATRKEWAREAKNRVDCLRGFYGPRPWVWKPAL